MAKYKTVKLHLTSGKKIVFRKVELVTWDFEGSIGEDADFGNTFVNIYIETSDNPHIIDRIKSLFGVRKIVPDMNHICAIEVIGG